MIAAPLGLNASDAMLCASVGAGSATAFYA